MKINRTTASFQVSGAELDLLQHEAAKHGVSKGVLARDYALRLIHMQLEDALVGQGAGGEKALVHTQIAGMERRVAATVGKLQDELEDVKAVLAVTVGMLDAFVGSWLVHTPEVPQALKAEYAQAAKARYEKILARVASGVQSGDSVVARVHSLNAGV